MDAMDTYLEQASDLLANILGPQSSQNVKPEWCAMHDNKGRTFYRLTIRDITDHVSSDFAPDELQNPLHMRVRLYRLWGDLLQLRNNQQNAQAQILSGQIAAAHGGP